jgi:hypothetical protein
MSAVCRLVGSSLADVEAREQPVRAGGMVPALADRHVRSCLACQAEAARYRKLLRVLGSLSTVLDVAPAGVAARIEHGIDLAEGRPAAVAAGERQTPSSSTLAAAAGALAAAAGTVAVLRWMRARSAA